MTLNISEKQKAILGNTILCQIDRLDSIIDSIWDKSNDDWNEMGDLYVHEIEEIADEKEALEDILKQLDAK